jgi:hypothetical protein
MYWDINDSLTYNALFNFVIGNRGCGKSYGCKRHVIKRFLKYGEQFAYVRRFMTEFQNIGNWFSDISMEFPDCEFEVKGNLFYINGEIAGYGFALTKAKIQKSASFPLIKMLVFDEFILDKGFHHYLPDEVTCFLDLYETIFRMRDGRAYFLANAISFTNPYFLHFGIERPKHGKTIVCKNDVLVQVVAEVDFIDAKKKTRFAKLIADTEYSKYSIDNETLRDNDSFVLKDMPKYSHYGFGLKSGGKRYGVWYANEASMFWISEKYDPGFKMVYALTLDDHTPNTMLLKGIAKSENVKTLAKAFKMGLVYFDSVKTKNVMMESMKYFG